MIKKKKLGAAGKASKTAETEATEAAKKEELMPTLVQIVTTVDSTGIKHLKTYSLTFWVFTMHGGICNCTLVQFHLKNSIPIAQENVTCVSFQSEVEVRRLRTLGRDYHIFFHHVVTYSVALREG